MVSEPGTASVGMDGPPPYVRDAADVLDGLGSDAATGLSTAEAAARLSRYGPNEIGQGEAAVGVGGRARASCATR